MVKRLGVTMRVGEAIGYKESRDCLARDWYSFLTYALVEVPWIPVPNLGGDVIDYVRRWKLDGFILSGGNDLGESLERDETEKILLDYAIAKEYAVFGVCRGLEMIQHYHGGQLARCRREEHVATFHSVSFTEHANRFRQAGNTRHVNSFHTQAVAATALASPLLPFAVTDDGWVEGILHPHEPIVAVQWHPERIQRFSEIDRTIIRTALGLENIE